MNKSALVVARYNEDVAWINRITAQVPDLNIFIYNKGNAPMPHINGVYVYQARENVGNEAETYLWHMMETVKYNVWFAEITAFVQGNPFDHVNEDMLVNTLNNPQDVKDFIWLAKDKLKCHLEQQCHHGGLPIASFYKDLMGTELETGFTFGVGGMFATTHNAIMNRTLGRYKHARNLVLGAYRDNEPWCILERIWNRVILVP